MKGADNHNKNIYTANCGVHGWTMQE